MQEDPPSRWPGRCVAALVAAQVAVHAAWLHAHRAGGPLDVDEAAYLAFAFEVTNARHRIVTGPLLVWPHTGAVAPLVPILTAPLHLVLGRSIEVSHLTNLVFFAVTVAVTYLLARRLAPPWWAALAATVVATAPGITDYTRHYHFAVASTAAVTLALLALLRSEHLRRRGWSLAFGVALGVALLTRTFVVAFAPGLVLAAVLLVWRGTGDRRRATAHLALALVAAGVLAGSWYVFSAPDVRDYLTGYGYGVESTSYGATAVASVQWWLSDAVAVMSDGLYLPVTVVLALGATAGAVTVLRGRPRGARLAAVLDSDALPVVVAVATGFGALLTSGNQGTGFVLPLLPGAVVLGVALTARCRPPALATTVAVALVLVAAANVAVKAQVVSALDGEVAWRPAAWATLRVSSGESIIDRYLAAYDDRDEGREDGWLAANRELYHQTVAHAPADDPDPEVLFLVEGPNLNSSVPLMISQLEDERRFAGRNPAEAEIGGLRDADALTAVLRSGRTAAAGALDQVVTGPEALSWPGRGLPEDVTTTAARAAGFTPVARIALPDGRTATLWAATDDGD